MQPTREMVFRKVRLYILDDYKASVREFGPYDEKSLALHKHGIAVGLTPGQLHQAELEALRQS